MESRTILIWKVQLVWHGEWPLHMSVGLGLYATSHRGVPRAAIAMESSPVDLVVYDGLELLHRGSDCTPATSTKLRRLVLGSGKQLRSKMFVVGKVRGLLQQARVWARLAKNRGVSWCLSSDRWQEVFGERCQARGSMIAMAQEVCTAQSLFAPARSVDSTCQQIQCTWTSAL